MRREIVIVGAGHAGLCLAIGLERLGIDSYTILEKGPRLGGTWRDNIYPGVACDSPAFAYCYSFEQWTDWSRKWAPGAEILAYQEHCARKYGVLEHIRFETELASARWRDDSQDWQLRTGDGRELVADVLVSATGQLNRPKLPSIRGLEELGGPCFHSGRWDPAFDPAGKRVAVIGTAASAVQLVPELAGSAQKLLVFQRSPNWIVPKNDRVYPRWERRLYGRVPGLARLYRWWLWLSYELRYPVMRQNRWLSGRATRMAMDHLAEQISDPDLRRRLIPDYPIAAKRVLISDDYYPALARNDVDLIDEPIERVTAGAIVTRSGAEHPVDAIVLATGFDSTSFLAPMELTGSGGRSLTAAWERGAEAYLGISVAGFPNLFIMYGPNTNLGHNSIIFMLECQARYILDCLAQMGRQDLRSIDVRAEVQDTFNAEIQAALEDSAWAQVPQSWYRHRSGRITNNWPYSTAAYWWRTRNADLADYHTRS